ncbi:hypothetical protein V8E54_010400 [Elaphomyces granulatus]
MTLVDVPMMEGIINILANSTQNQNSPVNCFTGNCTFPMINGITHSTIGMCSKCIDITSTVKHANNKTLPNGLSLGDVPDGVIFNALGGTAYGSSSLDSILSQVEEQDFADIIPASAFNWTMITFSQNGGVLSTACSMYLCMRHYYAGLVDGGEFNERLVSTVPALPVFPAIPAFSTFIDPIGNSMQIELNDSYVGLNASCVIDGKTYNLTNIQPNHIEISPPTAFLTLDGTNLTLPSECINGIDSSYVNSVANFSLNILTGNCSVSDKRLTECQGGTGIGQGWWLLSGLYNFSNATLETVQSTFDSIAQSITNRLRIDNSGTVVTKLVHGTAIKTDTCIAFSWKWLLFPALHLILTAIFLAIAMLQPIYEKVEKPLWKSSILPLLYASPGTQLMASEEHDMEAKSKVTIARLENSEDKWSFVDISGERA